MKTLFILRHAKSSWKHHDLADHDRPLNKRGVRDAVRMGELLRREELLPDLILSSSAVRARRTVELFIAGSGFEGELVVNRDLYAHYPEAYLDQLIMVDDRYGSVMVVGHNPGVEELLEALTGEWERMPTAALAQVSLSIRSWSELEGETQGELVNLWRPKELTS
ncbi:MAG: histidine phosphatase family protein [Chloroflexota bacterium]|nr:histidine phosphatase family protein [Chloroflexota bacterium]